MKTHKGTKKVLNVRAGGSIAIGKPGSRHNTGKQATKQNRRNRKGSTLSHSDYSRIKSVL